MSPKMTTESRDNAKWRFTIREKWHEIHKFSHKFYINSPKKWRIEDSLIVHKNFSIRPLFMAFTYNIIIEGMSTFRSYSKMVSHIASCDQKLSRITLITHKWTICDKHEFGIRWLSSGIQLWLISEWFSLDQFWPSIMISILNNPIRTPLRVTLILLKHRY